MHVHSWPARLSGRPQEPHSSAARCLSAARSATRKPHATLQPSTTHTGRMCCTPGVSGLHLLPGWTSHHPRDKILSAAGVGRTEASTESCSSNQWHCPLDLIWKAHHSHVVLQLGQDVVAASLPGSCWRLSKQQLIESALVDAILFRFPGMARPDGQIHCDWGCGSLQVLPTGIGAMYSLRLLELSGCTSLISLPRSLEGLTSLTRLVMGACTSLQTLPDSIGSLSQLQVLDLQGCWSLLSLPECIGGRVSLKLLDTHGCLSLKHVQTIGNS